MEDWHDIKDIHEFEEYHEFSNYVVLVKDDDGEVEDDGYYTDIAFGIALIPKGTVRFYRVPYDENSPE